MAICGSESYFLHSCYFEHNYRLLFTKLCITSPYHKLSANALKPPINSLVIVDTTLLRCPRSKSKATIHIKVDSILRLAITAQ